MAKTTQKSYWKNLKDITRNSSDSVAYREDFMIIGPLAIIGAVVGAIGGAIALPMMYATNFGLGLVMGLTGLVTGGVVGGAAPLALHKLAYTLPFGLLNPKNYKKAWDKTKAQKNTAQEQSKKPVKKKPAIKNTTKLDNTKKPKQALNQAANDTQPKPEANANTASSPKNSGTKNAR